MEEVATMKSYLMSQASVLLASACAPSAMLPAAAPVAVLAAERAPAAWAPQTLTQAKSAQVLVPASAVVLVPASAVVLVPGSAVEGINGFTDIDTAKRHALGGNGVPPRGRPV